jgi:hypothetical protein
MEATRVSKTGDNENSFCYQKVTTTDQSQKHIKYKITENGGHKIVYYS